jgi:hypothetical protein
MDIDGISVVSTHPPGSFYQAFWRTESEQRKAFMAGAMSASRLLQNHGLHPLVH